MVSRCLRHFHAPDFVLFIAFLRGDTNAKVVNVETENDHLYIVYS